MKFAPAQFLYLMRLEAYKKKYGKSPGKEENDHMILKAMHDYKSASKYEQSKIDTLLEEFKSINYIEDRKKSSSKPKNKRR